MTEPTLSAPNDLPTEPLQAGATVAVNRNHVNLRAWMSTSAPVRAQLSRGQCAVLLCDPFRFERRAWAHVRLLDTGRTGCIAAELLDLVEASPLPQPIEHLTAMGDAYCPGDFLTNDVRLPLHGGPGIDHTVEHEVERNSLGIALDEPVAAGGSRWVLVRFPVGSGWVMAASTQLLARESKWIEVDLRTQTLIAWEDATRVGTNRISSGKRGFPTPDGNFPISEKIPVRHLRASVRGEKWDIPAVPWIMVFRHSGFYIHAAYWHEDFGRPVSHGCVTVPVDDAEWLYDWTPLGTRLWIHR